MSIGDKAMMPLRQAWATVSPRLKIMEPVEFAPDDWAVVERMRTRFNERDTHARLPMPIARFREAALNAVWEHATRHDDLVTVNIGDNRSLDRFFGGRPDAMARYARLYNDDVDELMRILVPAARYRKGHYAYGRFTVPEPHGLHTDHSAEDPDSEGEPICIARIGTLGTHYVAGDYRAHDAGTRAMLDALTYWTPGPEGEPEHVLDELLKRDVLRTIPVNHVVLMVAGNGSEHSQVTRHIAARPPEGGLHSVFFQRQYRLAPRR